jgi:hypothetical protein
MTRFRCLPRKRSCGLHFSRARSAGRSQATNWRPYREGDPLTAKYLSRLDELAHEDVLFGWLRGMASVVI